MVATGTNSESVPAKPDPALIAAEMQRLTALVKVESMDDGPARNAISDITKLLPDELAVAALIDIVENTQQNRRDDAIEALCTLSQGRLENNALFDALMDLTQKKEAHTALGYYKKSIMALGLFEDMRATFVITSFLEDAKRLVGNAGSFEGLFLTIAISEALIKIKDPLAVLALENAADVFTSQSHISLYQNHDNKTPSREEEWGPFVYTLNSLAACGITNKTLEIFDKKRPSSALPPQPSKIALRDSGNPRVAEAIKRIYVGMNGGEIKVYKQNELEEMTDFARAAFKDKKNRRCTHPITQPDKCVIRTFMRRALAC
ncbi:MAG: hypothetical protein V1492_04840 [Candidatus Micrarchaeota archaeon]